MSSFECELGACPAAVNAQLQPAVARTDGAIPLSSTRRLDDVIAGSASQNRVLTFLLTVFALLALLLAASGSYGAARWSVVERMPEFGMRMAIGATRCRDSKRTGSLAHNRRIRVDCRRAGRVARDERNPTPVVRVTILAPVSF